MSTAYCMKCEGKHTIKGETSKKAKNGAYLVRGKCSKCGGKVATFKKG